MHERPFQPIHLYIQIRNELARRIASDEYPPGALLPNEFALAQEMRVSVGTVRKAVELLNAERLVIRSQGRGTIVADRQSADYRSKFDRIRNPDGTPIAWRLREIGRETRAATEAERQQLQLGRDQRVIAIRRAREVGGESVKTEYSRLPFDIFGDIAGLDITETVIENLCVLRGVSISASDERISISAAIEEQALEFGIPVGAPLLRMERRIYDAADRPIEWRIAYCHLGDRRYHAHSPVGSKSPSERASSAGRPGRVSRETEPVAT
jgi:GntR family transcriptional regulator